MKRKLDYSIYLVTDSVMIKDRQLPGAVEEAILGGVTLIQLREKQASSREFYQKALLIKDVTDKYNIPLIINDRADIALAVDADGVHLGQKDLPLSKVRIMIGGDKIIGISAATMEQAKDAISGGADYLGVGAIFPTSTKADAAANSADNLKSIKSTFPHMPMVGIGGINESNINILKATGCDGAAVVSAILAAPDIRMAAKRLKELWTHV